MQRTKCNIKIFSDPMPGSNERSIQLVGSQSQISECVEHFLDDIGKVSGRMDMGCFWGVWRIRG